MEQELKKYISKILQELDKNRDILIKKTPKGIKVQTLEIKTINK
jgi:hypothetical protein